MKLAFVSHTSYPEFIGGREHHIHNLASVLSKTDEVIVFSGSKTKVIERQKLNGYTLVRIPMISIKVSRNPLQIYRIMPRLFSELKKERFDLIHAFEYGSYSTNIAHLYSKKYNIPSVLTVYGYQFRSPLLKFFKFFYDHLIGKQMLNEAKRIFCPSGVQYKEILKVIKIKNIYGKIIFQENCIKVDNYKDIVTKKELLKQYNLSDEIKLLTVARILPRKGIKYLIFALDKVIRQHKFKNVKLIIVGPDCGELKNIKDITKQLKLENNVVIVGAMPYHQVKDFLGICDIFVLPSLYEGLPLALLEAMAAGRAVIFSDLSCAQKIITNGKDGLLVNFADVDSLANAILRLSTEEKFREYLGLNAKQKVAEFNSQIEASRVKKIYAEVMNSLIKN